MKRKPTPRRLRRPNGAPLRRLRAKPVGGVDPRTLPPSTPYPCVDPNVGATVSGDDFAGKILGCATPPPGKRGPHFAVGTIASGSAIGRAWKRRAARAEALRSRYEGEDFDARPARRAKRPRADAPPPRELLALPAPEARTEAPAPRARRHLPVIQPKTRRHLPVVQPERRPPALRPRPAPPSEALHGEVVDVTPDLGPVSALRRAHDAVPLAVGDVAGASAGRAVADQSRRFKAREAARIVSSVAGFAQSVGGAEFSITTPKGRWTRRVAIIAHGGGDTFGVQVERKVGSVTRARWELVGEATLPIGADARRAIVAILRGGSTAESVPRALAEPPPAPQPPAPPRPRRHLPVVQPATRRRLRVLQPDTRPEFDLPARLQPPRTFQRDPAPTEASAPVGAVLPAAASPEVSADEARWSPYQRTVFQWVTEGTGNAVVEAVAGSGKSTTIVEAVRRIPPTRTVLILAFNVSVKDELTQKFASFPNVTVRTLNSHAFHAMSEAWKPVSIPTTGDEQAAQYQDKARFDDILRAARVPPPVRFWRSLSEAEQRRMMRDGISEDRYRKEVERWNRDYDALKKLIELCRGFLATTSDAIVAVQNEYDLLVRRYERGRDPAPWTWTDPRRRETYTTADVVRWVQAALRASLDRPADGRVARFDAVFPTAMRDEIQPETFDWIFVDETQDMDVGQLRVVQKSVAPGGRVAVVGDGKQAIYRFRGADMTAMQRMERELSARRLPLSVSYRVPACAADLARRVVPWFEVPAGTPEGTCAKVSAREMLRSWRDGDFVISRTNAPLVPLAIMAVQQGHDVLALGLGDLRKVLRTVARGAEQRVPGWRDVEVFREAIREFGQSERERIFRQEFDKRARYHRGKKAQDLEEEVADLPAVKLVDLATQALQTLIGRARTPGDVDKKIDALNYGGARDGGVPENAMRGKLVFTTVHKIKGAEANRTWVLDETFGFRGEIGADGRPKVKHGEGMTDAARQEEVNLWYVAITRAKNLRADAATGTPAQPGAVYFVENLKGTLGEGFADDEEEGTSGPRANPSRRPAPPARRPPPPRRRAPVRRR